MKDGFLAVGSNDGDTVWSSGHKKAELHEFGTNAWIPVNAYPFGSSTSLINFAMVFIDPISSFVVIGGLGFSQIAIFANGEWSSAGGLSSARDVSIRFFYSQNYLKWKFLNFFFQICTSVFRLFLLKVIQ